MAEVMTYLVRRLTVTQSLVVDVLPVLGTDFLVGYVSSYKNETMLDIKLVLFGAKNRE